MSIKGFIKLSLVDWDGRISSVIFLPSCNFRCPFCYNVSLVLRPHELKDIPLDSIITYLKTNKKFIDGIVISGGEPTIHKDLPEICSVMKDIDFPVKLDTNGTNPELLEQLIDDGLVDYVAMDVKAPLREDAYFKVSGIKHKDLLDNVKQSIQILMEGRVDYEFRTTVVPTLHSKQDIEDICREIRGCKKYALQSFKGDVELIDPSLKDVQPLKVEEMQELLTIARKYIKNSLIRGYASYIAS